MKPSSSLLEDGNLVVAFGPTLGGGRGSGLLGAKLARLLVELGATLLAVFFAERAIDLLDSIDGSRVRPTRLRRARSLAVSRSARIATLRAVRRSLAFSLMR